MLLRMALILSLLALASSQRNILSAFADLREPTTSNQSSTFFNLPAAIKSQRNISSASADLRVTTTSNKSTTFFDLLAPIKSRRQNILQDFSDSSSSFALDLLVRLTDIVASERRDFIVSPFSIWLLLLPLVEGAGGITLAQMRSVLRINEENILLAFAYRTVKDYLSLDTPSVKVSSLRTIFIDSNQPVNHDYQKTIESQYDANIFYPIDLQNPIKAASLINDEVRAATNNFIRNVILPEDLVNTKLLLLSSLFFRGQWKTPFNQSMTRSVPFYDEDGRQIGNVDMMVQNGRFHYTGMSELEGHVLELPYGEDDQMSMLLILPKRGVSLQKTARNLQNIGIAPIFERLVADAVDFEDEEVEVFVPKFTSTSDFVLNKLLVEMGMIDLLTVFANLTKIYSDLYLTRILHSTKIIVDEKGTTAAEVPVAALKFTSKFLLNRPFMYMIVEKQTNMILFCGQLMNPNKVNAAD